MPQIYIREDQYDELIALDLGTRDELLEFVRDVIDVGVKKELRARKKTGFHGR